VSSIRLPTTQRLRALLSDQGAPRSADSPLTYRDLGLLLEQRRDDPAFWAPLTEILKELVDSAVHGKSPVWQRIPQLKILATWDVQELSKRLRGALPQWPNVDHDSRVALCGRSDASHDTRTAVLSAFLLLGLAAGCSNSSSSGNANDAGAISSGGSSTGGSTSVTPATGGTSTCPYPPTDAGRIAISQSDAGIPGECSAPSVSALWDIIDEACLSSAEKQAIFEEFSDLKASWCDGLVELFKTESPQVIAAQLENILECRGVLDAEFTAEMQQKVVQGIGCMVPLYKGVSFPESDTAGAKAG
jgi:hypothetical protein